MSYYKSALILNVKLFPLITVTGELLFCIVFKHGELYKIKAQL